MGTGQIVGVISPRDDGAHGDMREQLDYQRVTTIAQLGWVLLATPQQVWHRVSAGDAQMSAAIQGFRL